MTTEVATPFSRPDSSVEFPAVTLPGPKAFREELRLWPFDLPFPYRIAHEGDRVAVHSREWAQRMGLVSEEAELRRHDRHGMALFACLSYPDAPAEGLNLVSDWVSWWAIWNDFPDDPDFVREPGRPERFFASLAAVVTPSPQPLTPVSSDPHVNAFTDIWRRWCQGMSPRFIARTRKNWLGWFASCRTRCEHRRDSRTLEVEEYLTLRDMTGAVLLEMDVTERVGGYEVQPEFLESSPLKMMRRITMRVINITQDVQSLAKEEAAGDQHNMVIVLERRQNLTREKALRRIHERIRGYTDSFLRYEAEIPQFLDTLMVPVEERTSVYRHAADLRSLMRGCVDFCAASGRYQ
ncbi:terpene synthase family protein [Streptomyces sp. NPDC002577]